MVHAEKIVTAVQRGTANTRWRDFADIWTLSSRHPVTGSDLQHAVGKVASFRLGRVAKPEEIADPVVALASDRSAYMTGQALVIDGGWIAL